MRTTVLVTSERATVRQADGPTRTSPAGEMTTGDAMPGFVLDVESIVEASRRP